MWTSARIAGGPGAMSKRRRALASTNHSFGKKQRTVGQK